MKVLATALMLLAAATAAQSQTVWRCGPDGRSYSDQPCTAGRAVDVADARTSEQLRSGSEVAVRNQRLAQVLVQDRHRRERDTAAAGPGLAGFTKAAASPERPRAKPGIKPGIKPKARPQKPKAAPKPRSPRVAGI